MKQAPAKSAEPAIEPTTPAITAALLVVLDSDVGDLTAIWDELGVDCDVFPEPDPGTVTTWACEDFQFADHPVKDTDPSEIHRTIMIPVLEVTGLGVVGPENVFKKFVPAPLTHALVTQLQTVRMSRPCSVLKAEKVRVRDKAPIGAMIADMVSEFP